jgi:hypothetical protein
MVQFGKQNFLLIVLVVALTLLFSGFQFGAKAGPTPLDTRLTSVAMTPQVIEHREPQPDLVVLEKPAPEPKVVIVQEEQPTEDVIVVFKEERKPRRRVLIIDERTERLLAEHRRRLKDLEDMPPRLAGYISQDGEW